MKRKQVYDNESNGASGDNVTYDLMKMLGMEDVISVFLYKPIDSIDSLLSCRKVHICKSFPCSFSWIALRLSKAQELFEGNLCIFAG